MNNIALINQPVVRIIFSIALFFFIFIMPWWLSLAFLCAGIFVFSNFYESLVFALVLDGFYGVPGAGFFGLNTFFISIIGAVFIVSIFLKTRLRFYQ